MKTSAPILLMTGTIAPGANVLNLRVTDLGQRIAEYRRALQFNLGLLRSGDFGRIVFVENSGYGLEDFRPDIDHSGMADRVDLVSFRGNDGATEYQRLFLEIRLMRAAFDLAPALGASPPCRIWKVTGRYVVRNIVEIARKSKDGFDLIVHCRNRPIRFVETPVLGLSTATGAAVLDRMLDYERLKHHGEKALRELIDNGAFADMNIKPRLPCIPDYSGTRGYDGKSYDGFNYRLRHFARVLANRISPAAWI